MTAALLLACFSSFLIFSFSRPLNAPVSEGKTIITGIGRVRVIKRLGAGSYGSVYKAKWIEGKRLVALKVESAQAISKCVVGNAPEGYLSIEHEWKMMAAMNGTDGFPSVYTNDFSGHYKYYIMQLLGQSLSDIRKSSPNRRIPVDTLRGFAHQMLDRIAALHARDALMLDIHLGNFLVVNKKVYVIDLGMAIPFKYESGRHVRYTSSSISNNCKNNLYASMHDAEGFSVSRRDDLERLLYVLVDLSIDYLPWMHAKGSRLIQDIKKNSSPERICVGYADWLLGAMKYVFSLSFFDKPNYAYIHELFDKKSR